MTNIDLINELYTGSGDKNFNVDINGFMDDGGGRFANGPRLELIDNFLIQQQIFHLASIVKKI